MILGEGMTVPVFIERSDGDFAVSVVGNPELRVVGRTKQEALAAMTAELQSRTESGLLAFLELPQQSLSRLVGKYSDDPTLREICTRAYTDRDLERDTLEP